MGKGHEGSTVGTVSGETSLKFSHRGTLGLLLEDLRQLSGKPFALGRQPSESVEGKARGSVSQPIQSENLKG